MKICRKPFATILIAVAIAVPVGASDVNSTPTSSTPLPPPPPCVTAGAPSDCSGNEALPNVAHDAAALVMDLLRSMLSIY